MSEIDALTFAVLAVALAPFAYWQLGHRRGYGEGGSSPWLRRAFVAGWLGCMLLAAYGGLF